MISTVNHTGRGSALWQLKLFVVRRERWKGGGGGGVSEGIMKRGGSGAAGGEEE